MSTESIDQLAHAIANIAHVEKPCLENMLAIKKLEIAKEPVDIEHLEATKKVDMWETEIVNLNSWTLHWAILKMTCGLQAEKDHAATGLVKAKKLVLETSDKVQAEKDKIHLVELQNEKNAIDYRTLQNYREEITVLLDSALKVNFPGEEKMKLDMEDCKLRSDEKFANIKKLETVKDLLKTADYAILEAILELRSSAHKESLMGEGKIYFPEAAYESLQKARALYPELPGFSSPTDYVNEADETGAYYSPMQKYLWDVRHRMAELIAWCAKEDIVLMEAETQIQIELGQKVDEYNLERRRVLKEGIL